jgi:hypothetical protein
VALADDYSGLLAFYSIAPFDVFTDRLEATAEYLFRVNCGIVVGNFELDWDDGVVRYKTAFDFNAVSSEIIGSTPIATQVASWLLQANLSTFEQYLPGVRAVIQDGVHPEAALRRVR